MVKLNTSMSPELDPGVAIVQFGRYMIDVDIFPVYLVAHLFIACFMVREDSKDLGPRFRQKHPLASWLSSVLTGLAGVFVINFLFGEPLVDVMKEDMLVIFLTGIWYLMNYCPFDVVYKLVRLPVVYMSLAVLQEALRAKCIYLGLQQAARAYPRAWTIKLLGGVVNGNGYGYLKVVENFIRGKWNPRSNDFLEVSYFAKSGLYASAALMLQEAGLLPVPEELLFLVILAVFVACRIVITVSPVKDPLLPLEAPVCRLLFGSSDTGKQANGSVSARADVGKADDKKRK